MTQHESKTAISDEANDRAPSRRELLGTAATFAAACAMCSAGVAFGAPPTTMPAANAPGAGTPAGEFDAGPVTAFATDGVYDSLLKSHKVLILRAGKQLFAASAICPHRSKLVMKTGEADPAIKCPAHNSTFDASGIVLKGPAKTSLPRFAIRIDKGHVFVDPSKSFEEHDWNDPKASATA